MLSCVPHKIISLLHPLPFARDEDTLQVSIWGHLLHAQCPQQEQCSLWRWQDRTWDLAFLLLASLLLFCSVWSREELGRPLYSVKGECPCLRGEERRASEFPLLSREGA